MELSAQQPQQTQQTDVSISLDSNSIEILQKVDKLHRTSLINLGISLISKTGYYKTLSGEDKQLKLDEITSLDSINEVDVNETPNQNQGNKPTTQTPAAQTSSWDNF